MTLISDSVSRANVPVEAQFARQFYESLPQDKFLNSLTPLIKDGINKVEWPLVEKEIEKILRYFFGEAFSKSLSANRGKRSRGVGGGAGGRFATLAAPPPTPRERLRKKEQKIDDITVCFLTTS